jgi:hypothetical protein
MLDSIRHRLNREHDIAADVDIDVTTDMDVDMAADMDVDVADDMDAHNPCFHGPVSSDTNILSLLIISI